MNDDDRGSIWIWAGIVCCVVCFVAAFKAVDEFYFRYSGTKTKGWVTSVIEDPPEGPRVGYVVWYDFTKQTTGKRMRGSSFVPAAERFKYVNGNRIDIEYYGDPFLKSRIQRTGSRLWPVLFAISALATIASIVALTVSVVRKSRAEATLPSEADETEDDEAPAHDEP